MGESADFPPVGTLRKPMITFWGLSLFLLIPTIRFIQGTLFFLPDYLVNTGSQNTETGFPEILMVFLLMSVVYPILVILGTTWTY